MLLDLTNLTMSKQKKVLRRHISWSEHHGNTTLPPAWSNVWLALRMMGKTGLAHTFRFEPAPEPVRCSSG
jgi:hypothetical protein